MLPVWDCMGPTMAVLAGVQSETGQKTGERRLSWPVFLLTLAAVTSSSLSALSLYQLVALRAEVEGLKSEVYRRREDGQEAKHGDQVRHTLADTLIWVGIYIKTCQTLCFIRMYCFLKDCVVSVQTENMSSRRGGQEPLHQLGSQQAFTLIRRKRMVSATETLGKTQ